MKTPKWIFCDAITNEIYCERCGKREKMRLPMPITDFVKWCEGFGLMHRHCQPQPPKRPDPPPPRDAGDL